MLHQRAWHRTYTSLVSSCECDGACQVSVNSLYGAIRCCDCSDDVDDISGIGRSKTHAIRGGGFQKGSAAHSVKVRTILYQIVDSLTQGYQVSAQLLLIAARIGNVDCHFKAHLLRTRS